MKRGRLGTSLLAVIGLVVACSHGDPDAPSGSDTQVEKVAASPANAPASGAAPAVTACGKSGLPDCPLQSWMKATLQPTLKAGDLARLSDALDQLALAEPSGFSGWASAARAGATAARKGDVEGVRAQCRACHDQLRPRFRAEMRGAHIL